MEFYKIKTKSIELVKKEINLGNSNFEQILNKLQAQGLMTRNFLTVYMNALEVAGEIIIEGDKIKWKISQ